MSWSRPVLGGDLWRLNHVPASLLRSRYLVLGVVALLFGTAVLSVNFANEYFALNGETGLTDLPSVRSMLRRTGLNKSDRPKYPGVMAWPAFLKSQFYRIAGMSLPYSFTPGPVGRKPGAPLGLQDVIGILVSGTCLVGLAFVRHKVLWATLVLSGFCWGLPMRNTTAFPYHNHESLVYIGLPLLLFSLILLAIHRLFGRRLVVGLAATALLVFVLSSFQMALVGYAAEAAQRQKHVIADLEVIRKMTAGKVASIPKDAYYIMRYALTGTILLFPNQKSRFADFVISRQRYDAAVLTPENRRVFLYHPSSYEETIDAIIKEAGEPLIHAESREHAFDVYLSDNRLYYVRPQPTTGTAKFFLHVTPVDESDLPEHRKQWNFDNLDFYLASLQIPHSKRAIAVRELPPYDVARIRTGQYIKEDGHYHNLWKAEVNLEKPDDG